MKIIVGLGNPGILYKNTRHNIGFMVIDALAKKYRISVKKKLYRGLCGSGRIKGLETVLFKSLTYMNLSGEAVKAVYADRSDKIEDLLVVADDFNLPIGQIRLREKGSSGGHNGLSSIIELLGKDFARLKLGIGVLPEKGDPSSFVLSRFSRKDKKDLKYTIEDAVGCVELWIKEGSKEAMNRYNGS